MDQILSNIQLLLAFPIINLDIVINGLMVGALFALAAYGLALVWGVMNIKNLAQGDFVITGGYICWWLAQHGVDPFIGIAVAFVLMALLGGILHGTGIQKWSARQGVAMAVVSMVMIVTIVIGADAGKGIESALLGVSMPLGMTGNQVAAMAGAILGLMVIANGGIYNLIIARVIERDLFTSLLATFGLAIMMAQLLNLMFGSDTQSVDLGYDSIQLDDSGIINVPISKLVGVLIAAVLAISVILFMKNSRMGQAIRATAQDARAARVMGIDTEKVYAFTFALNSAICGAAGAIIVMAWVIQPFYGITYSVRAFVIVTAAGLGNMVGVIAAGLGIGTAEQYGSHIFGIGYQQAIAVLLLLFVLLFRLMQQRRQRQVLQ
jgi:branched-chain amino acid transport system permease protein